MCYRRDSGSTVARLLQAKLIQNRLRVFLDVDNLNPGQFDGALLNRIAETANFIVVLTPDCLNRCADEHDWLRQEIAQALRTNKNIIPVIMPGFEFPKPEALPVDIADLATYQAVYYSHEFFSAMVDKTVQYLRLNVETEDAGIFPPHQKELTTSQDIQKANSGEGLYLEREVDQVFLNAVRRGDSLILLKAARWMGKTALLAHGLKKLRAEGFNAIVTNLQKFDANSLASLEAFFLSLGDSVADQLDLNVFLSDLWNSKRTPTMNFERYIRKEVLTSIPQLVWILDEVDRVFPSPFCDHFFGLLRSWHNQRAFEPSGPFSRLTIVLAYGSERQLFITDIHQSPLNVGNRLVIGKFSREEVKKLNDLYGSPLKHGEQLERFHNFLNGHPYLSTQGLRTLVRSSVSFETFMSDAVKEDGPFGGHLRILSAQLEQEPELHTVVQNMLRGKPCQSIESFHRLRTMGLLEGNTMAEAQIFCELYASYLQGSQAAQPKQELLQPVLKLMHFAFDDVEKNDSGIYARVGKEFTNISYIAAIVDFSLEPISGAAPWVEAHAQIRFKDSRNHTTRVGEPMWLGRDKAKVPFRYGETQSLVLAVCFLSDGFSTYEHQHTSQRPLERTLQGDVIRAEVTLIGEYMSDPKFSLTWYFKLSKQGHPTIEIITQEEFEA